MSRKSCFSFLLLVFAVLCLAARDAHACSCVGTPTVLDSYEKSDAVVITRVISVEKAEQAAADGQVSKGQYYVDGVKSTSMIIERVFKGSMKVGDEITFGQGGGADCIWTFNEKMIGGQFLFYLSSREKNPAIWYGSGCGRSSGLNYVADDLLYLNKLDKVRGKTRLSGTVGFSATGALGGEGRRIRITGAGKTHEVKTDKNGVYEIYDLPAGRYLVEPELPPGWKVDPYYLTYSPGFAGDRESDADLKKIPVILEAKKHAVLDIHFEIDNALRGKVYDPEGKLMRGVCVSLILPQGEVPSFSLKSDCTEDDGTFEIKEIPAGSYVLAVNLGGKFSSREPFKRFYYPDVSERERATVINIGAGESLEGFDIRVPKLEDTVAVEGILLYSDGKPVAGERVVFKADATTNTKDTIDGDAGAMTDAKGRFSIRILKGLDGELSADVFAYVGEFENCPKLDALIKESDPNDRMATLKTDAVKIQTGRDLKEVELRFPFPGCKKAKTQEEKRPQPR